MRYPQEASGCKSFPQFAEMAKLWEFASNAPKFELKDIEAALDEIQVDFYLSSSSIVSFTFRP